MNNIIIQNKQNKAIQQNPKILKDSERQENFEDIDESEIINDENN